MTETSNENPRGSGSETPAAGKPPVSAVTASMDRYDGKKGSRFPAKGGGMTTGRSRKDVPKGKKGGNSSKRGRGRSQKNDAPRRPKPSAVRAGKGPKAVPEASPDPTGAKLDGNRSTEGHSNRRVVSYGQAAAQYYGVRYEDDELIGDTGVINFLWENATRDEKRKLLWKRLTRLACDVTEVIDLFAGSCSDSFSFASRLHNVKTIRAAEPDKTVRDFSKRMTDSLIAATNALFVYHRYADATGLLRTLWKHRETASRMIYCDHPWKEYNLDSYTEVGNVCYEAFTYAVKTRSILLIKADGQNNSERISMAVNKHGLRMEEVNTRSTISWYLITHPNITDEGTNVRAPVCFIQDDISVSTEDKNDAAVRIKSLFKKYRRNITHPPPWADRTHDDYFACVRDQQLVGVDVMVKVKADFTGSVMIKDDMERFINVAKRECPDYGLTLQDVPNHSNPHSKAAACRPLAEELSLRLGKADCRVDIGGSVVRAMMLNWNAGNRIVLRPILSKYDRDRWNETVKFIRARGAHMRRLSRYHYIVTWVAKSGNEQEFRKLHVFKTTFATWHKFYGSKHRFAIDFHCTDVSYYLSSDEVQAIANHCASYGGLLTGAHHYMLRNEGSHCYFDGEVTAEYRDEGMVFRARVKRGEVQETYEHKNPWDSCSRARSGIPKSATKVLINDTVTADREYTCITEDYYFCKMVFSRTAAKLVDTLRGPEEVEADEEVEESEEDVQARADMDFALGCCVRNHLLNGHAGMKRTATDFGSKMAKSGPYRNEEKAISKTIKFLIAETEKAVTDIAAYDKTRWSTYEKIMAEESLEAYTQYWTGSPSLEAFLRARVSPRWKLVLKARLMWAIANRYHWNFLGLFLLWCFTAANLITIVTFVGEALYFVIVVALPHLFFSSRDDDDHKSILMSARLTFWALIALLIYYSFKLMRRLTCSLCCRFETDIDTPELDNIPATCSIHHRKHYLKTDLYKEEAIPSVDGKPMEGKMVVGVAREVFGPNNDRDLPEIVGALEADANGTASGDERKLACSAKKLLANKHASMELYKLEGHRNDKKMTKIDLNTLNAEHLERHTCVIKGNARKAGLTFPFQELSENLTGCFENNFVNLALGVSGRKTMTNGKPIHPPTWCRFIRFVQHVFAPGGTGLYVRNGTGPDGRANLVYYPPFPRPDEASAMFTGMHIPDAVDVKAALKETGNKARIEPTMRAYHDWKGGENALDPDELRWHNFALRFNKEYVKTGAAKVLPDFLMETPHFQSNTMPKTREPMTQEGLAKEPRQISDVNLLVKALTAPFFKELDKWCEENWPSWVMRSSKEDTIARMSPIYQMKNRAYADASRWDATCRDVHRAMELWLYSLINPCMKLMYNMCRLEIGTALSKDGLYLLIYLIIGSMASGGSDVGLGNAILNQLLHQFIAYELENNCDFDSDDVRHTKTRDGARVPVLDTYIVVKGDDLQYGTSSPNVTIEAVSEMELKLGFVFEWLTSNTSHPDYTHFGDFVSCHHWLGKDGKVRMIRKPGRVLARTPYIYDETKFGRAFTATFAAKALSAAYEYKDVPLMKELTRMQLVYADIRCNRAVTIKSHAADKDTKRKLEFLGLTDDDHIKTTKNKLVNGEYDVDDEMYYYFTNQLGIPASAIRSAAEEVGSLVDEMNSIAKSQLRSFLTNMDFEERIRGLSSSTMDCVTAISKVV